MPIKRLTYPAYPRDASDDRGVNTRLGEAHVHENLEILSDITESDIESIRKSLDVDWSNISPVGIDKLKELNDAAGYVTKPESIQSDVNYVYTSEGWSDLSTKRLVSLSASSANIDITEADLNSFKIDISQSVKNTLSKVNDKIDKVYAAVSDNITLFGSVGTLKDSGVNLNSLEKSANKSSSITSDSTTTYATSKAVKLVNDKLDAAIAGIGKLRGAVYNAFSSQGNSYTITSIEVDHGGYGYKNGDKFGIVGEVDAELSAVVLDDSGVISSFTIDNGGMFSEANSDVEVYPKSTEVTPTVDRLVTVKNIVYDNVPNSILSDIDNPLLGDTCYVNFDELHNMERSLYTYKAVNEVINGWVYTSCVAAYPLIKVLSAYVSNYPDIVVTTENSNGLLPDTFYWDEDNSAYVNSTKTVGLTRSAVDELGGNSTGYRYEVGAGDLAYIVNWCDLKGDEPMEWNNSHKCWVYTYRYTNGEHAVCDYYTKASAEAANYPSQGYITSGTDYPIDLSELSVGDAIVTSTYDQSPVNKENSKNLVVKEETFLRDPSKEYWSYYWYLDESGNWRYCEYLDDRDYVDMEISLRGEFPIGYPSEIHEFIIS